MSLLFDPLFDNINSCWDHLWLVLVRESLEQNVYNFEKDLL